MEQSAHLWATAEDDGMGDPVVRQPLRLLQAPGGSEQEALCDRGECIQVVLRQAILRADAYGARARPARLQPLHKQRVCLRLPFPAQ